MHTYVYMCVYTSIPTQIYIHIYRFRNVFSTLATGGITHVHSSSSADTDHWYQSCPVSYDYSGILELLHSLFLGKRQCTDISWGVKRAFLTLKEKKSSVPVHL